MTNISLIDLCSITTIFYGKTFCRFSLALFVDLLVVLLSGESSAVFKCWSICCQPFCVLDSFVLFSCAAIPWTNRRVGTFTATGSPLPSCIYNISSELTCDFLFPASHDAWLTIRPVMLHCSMTIKPVMLQCSMTITLALIVFFLRRVRMPLQNDKHEKQK